MQRRVAGALRVILVRDRRAEERHDAVAGVLVRRALEAVHAVGEDREEAIDDAVPLFRVELLGELHRALHVGEEHGHLLALAFEGGARGAGFCRRGAWACRSDEGLVSGCSGLGEVLVGLSALDPDPRLARQRSAAFAAELLARPHAESHMRDGYGQRRTAGRARLAACTVLCIT